MLDKNTLIAVSNRAGSVVGYTIPDLGNLSRQFQINETKEVPFEELKKLSYIPGGSYILENCLLIKNEEAIKELFNYNPEPEYYYSENDVKKLLVEGSMDEFLDCLDFAPEGVIELIKKYAVELEINDIRKRDAIMKKTGLNVTRAIEINSETAETEEVKETQKRRVSKEIKEESEGGTGRRVAPPKYKRV